MTYTKLFPKTSANRSKKTLHPILIHCVDRIQNHVINAHDIPIRLFETGRSHKRHNMLIQRGRTKDLLSQHLYDLEHDPPLYATAVDYVHYDGRWSWNLRDDTVVSWLKLFGNLVLDECPELEWGGYNRKAKNYCHFQLRRDILVANIDKYPCVLPK